MQEFSSISVSSYEAGSLAERLTEQSRDGWSVVTIVPTGSTITAYLCRDADANADTVDEPEGAVDSYGTADSSGTADTEPALAALVPDPVDAEPSTSFAEETSHVPAEEPAGEPAPEPAVSEPVESTATPFSATESASGYAVSEPAASEPATETTAAAAGAAPAGWYADPSGRFELRYWDGGQWTEHVSRSGQQYTDPPVA